MLKELAKMKKLQKPYLTTQNLLITQHLWKARYQDLSRISLKEYIKQNVNMDITIKNTKRVELNKKIASVVLITKTLKRI